MDVPALQVFVMAVVPPEERAAGSTVTNVPRSLAASVAPLIAGALLEKTTFGWPLVIAGRLKGRFRHRRADPVPGRRHPRGRSL